MAERFLPVRPDLARLRSEVETAALGNGLTQDAAQEAVARSYGVATWHRLELACAVVDAIWSDDAARLETLVVDHPELLHEDARGVPGSWGPPMSYAANLGRTALVTMLHAMGARDLLHAFERACLQGRIETARKLFALGARPSAGSVMGPAEALDADGLALLLELGAPPCDASGRRQAPIAMVLQTYSRDPKGKHRCIELLASTGIALPDSPPMAVHRGRRDLLESHLQRDPLLFTRAFAHVDIYPPELGCDPDHSLALHGAPLDGATLLHLCVDTDDLDLAHWMIDRGASPNARAAIDGEGFGGHTPLFGCVVSQPYRVGRRHDDTFARLLLDRGADTRARASLRKRLRFVTDESEHEYRDVSAYELGERFHDQDWVSPSVMALLRSR